MYTAANEKNKTYMQRNVLEAIANTEREAAKAYNEGAQLMTGSCHYFEKFVNETNYHHDNIEDLVKFIEKTVGSKLPDPLLVARYVLYKQSPEEWEDMYKKRYYVRWDKTNFKKLEAEIEAGMW